MNVFPVSGLTRPVFEISSWSPDGIFTARLDPGPISVEKLMKTRERRAAFRFGNTN